MPVKMRKRKASIKRGKVSLTIKGPVANLNKMIPKIQKAAVTRSPGVKVNILCLNAAVKCDAGAK